MQGDARERGEAASQWLRDHFEGDPAPHIDITWTVARVPEQGSYERLLEILFAPQPEDWTA